MQTHYHNQVSLAEVMRIVLVRDSHCGILCVTAIEWYYNGNEIMIRNISTDMVSKIGSWNMHLQLSGDIKLTNQQGLINKIIRLSLAFSLCACERKCFVARRERHCYFQDID